MKQTQGKKLPQDEREILRQRRKRIFSIRSLVLLLFCVALLYFIISLLDAESLYDIVTNTNPLYLGAAALFYFLSVIFKTVRYLFFFREHSLSPWRMFTVVSYHNFFNQIMPARTGELTLIYYLKRLLGLDYSRGLLSLLAVHFMDLCVVGLLFVVSFLIGATERVSPLLFGMAGVASIIAFGVVICIDRFMRIGARLYNAVANKTGLVRVSIIERIGTKLDECADVFGQESVLRKVPMLFVTSIFVWLSLYTFSYCVIQAFTEELTYFQSVLGATAAVLTNVLPINSFGSFGTMEAGWVGGYYLVGIETNVAILSAFTYHLVNFATAAVLALICRLIYRATGKKQ